MKRLELTLPHARCEVLIGTGAIRKLPRFDAEPFVVADTHTARYARSISRRVLVLPAGERTKNPHRLMQVWDAMARRHVDRYTPVVAVGGGVIGDLAGFAAATYMRGVPLIQVPTSMLAQVDAAIGGKTAVNLPQGKNLAGVFYQPRAIVIDPSVLRTLPESSFRTGLAEAVKYGMIKDASLFAMMERQADRILARDLQVLEALITRCVQIKLQVVRIDEREQGPRMILNYGHTVGHAIEKATGYRVSHGEAISIGMNREGRMAVRMGLCSSRAIERQNALLGRFGLPLEGRFPEGPYRRAMSLDKKAKSGKLRFVLPLGIGRVRFPITVPPAFI